MRRGCASPRCSGVPDPAAVQTPSGSPSGGPGPCRCVPLLPRAPADPRVPAGRTHRDSPATAPAEPSPSPSPACSKWGFPLPENVSQLIPLTLRQHQGSVLVPVSERGRARADRASPGHGSPGRCQPGEVLDPVPRRCKPPGNACQCSRCCWTENPSLLHKPLGLPATASQRGHWPGGRQQAWHIPGRGVGIIHLSFSK